MDRLHKTKMLAFCGYYSADFERFGVCVSECVFNIVCDRCGGQRVAASVRIVSSAQMVIMANRFHSSRPTDVFHRSAPQLRVIVYSIA